MKTRFAAIAAATAVTLSPAIANADAIDDALAKIPAGQISCTQAEAYWTTEAEYESIRSQAQLVAPFHPRGGEITDALNRVEEAANRCGLKGGGAQAPAPGAPAPSAPAPNAPGVPSAPAQPAPPADAINVGVAPGTPYVTVPAGPVSVVIPDVLTIIEQAIAQITGQVNLRLPNLGSSF
ncbi:hypothetical protein [Corynebacterium guangdongense]|uniref:Secreted protein n=1 Tax=Corynebacterium guangdongense TaxID=1783348 RepID=A0ABU2A0E9_9CORY|nr:hypothetical protein [Corynebacterium guangdongense]MDR7330668.1 hypothetical protein [Corynebacterium guangdongense]